MPGCTFRHSLCFCYLLNVIFIKKQSGGEIKLLTLRVASWFSKKKKTFCARALFMTFIKLSWRQAAQFVMKCKYAVQKALHTSWIMSRTDARTCRSWRIRRRKDRSCTRRCEKSDFEHAALIPNAVSFSFPLCLWSFYTWMKTVSAGFSILLHQKFQ